MCLFLPSVKFFLQISKWFLGSINVNKRVLFHVKWYHPESCWSVGFFPRVSVRWSDRWPFMYSGGSWSPKPACCLQLSPLALLGPSYLVTGSWNLCYYLFLFPVHILNLEAASHQRMSLLFWLMEGGCRHFHGLFWVLSEVGFCWTTWLLGSVPTPPRTRCLFNLYESNTFAWRGPAGIVCLNDV